MDGLSTFRGRRELARPSENDARGYAVAKTEITGPVS